LRKHNLSEPPDAGARFAERRTVPRYALVAAIDIFEPISNARISGKTSEVSIKGCYVETSLPLPLNTVVHLWIRRDNSTFETWGRIANVREGLGMGVAFFQAVPDQESVIVGWIAALSAEARL
jgi:PilZ domain